MAARIISTLAVLSLLGLNPAADPNCEDLTKSRELKDDYSEIMGKWVFTEGIANHDLYTNILKTVSSSWIEFSPSPLRDTVILSQRNKLNGTCEYVTTNSTIKNSTIYTTEKEFRTAGDLLPSCPGCITFSFESQTKNQTIKSLYLFTRSSRVSESEKDLYWKQAACLGFSKQPQFSYDGVTEFCREDEKISPPTDQTKPEDRKSD